MSSEKFEFTGSVAASKSLMNRALILWSFKTSLKLEGSSDSDDVLKLRTALETFLDAGKPESRDFIRLECGDGGTVLRFLALRVSRQPGNYELVGSERLFSRPQKELVSVLNQLGCHAELTENSLKIMSSGWKPQGDALHIPSTRSSQFLSAVALSSWGLDFDLPISAKDRISEGYWQMTRNLLTTAGMSLAETGGEIYIPKHQYPSLSNYSVEQDMSNAFAVAALAALKGRASFISLGHKTSLQPDARFMDLLEQMGCDISMTELQTVISKPEGELAPLSVSLSSSPDLFPVLSVLCSFANGESKLYGAPHLQFKESDRQQKVYELLSKLGVESELIEGGIKIKGSTHIPERPIQYDTDHDHRLAMAAGLFEAMGANVELSDRSVVKKSFPDFWKLLGQGASE